jgi:hypothetical protein
MATCVTDGKVPKALPRRRWQMALLVLKPLSDPESNVQTGSDGRDQSDSTVIPLSIQLAAMKRVSHLLQVLIANSRDSFYRS